MTSTLEPGELIREVWFPPLAEGAGYAAALVPIAVHTGPTRQHPLSGLTQEPCDYAANCLLGCRTRAKNSLDMTYLPMGFGAYESLSCFFKST